MDNIFDRAKARIEKYGHHKGGMYANSRRPYQSAACLMGALRAESDLTATPGYVLPSGSDILSEIITEQFPDRVKYGVIPLSMFNDHPDTTVDEVFAMLEKASVKLQEQV